MFVTAEVELAAGFQHDNFQIKVSTDSTNDEWSICTGLLVDIGANLPCISPVLPEPVVESNTVNG